MRFSPLFKALFIISFLLIIGEENSAAYTQSGYGSNNIGITKLFSSPNTNYVINNEYEIGVVSASACCIKEVVIERHSGTRVLNEKIVLNNEIIYIAGTPITVGGKESIIIPPDCCLLSVDKDRVLSREAYYHPEIAEVEVILGSQSQGAKRYTHCKLFYISNEPVNLVKDQVISLPKGCVILSGNKRKVLSYSNLFVAESDISCYVANVNKGTYKYRYGMPLVIPANCTVTFRNNGHLTNGFIKCNNTTIKAKYRQIFSNVVLVGSLRNKYIPVEWFGCNIKNDGVDNQLAFENGIIPSVLCTKTNIFHSQKGTYCFSEGYPLRNVYWGYDHGYIMDCAGIEVFGRGRKTIIKGMPRQGNNPADVFNLVDMKNLSIHDLSVTAIEGNGICTYGTNAFSLIHNLEDISISRCYVFDMPFVLKKTYPDGGKAYTIQVGAGTSQTGISIHDNYAKNVSYGLDYTKVQRKTGDKLENIVFENNRIENAIVGCVIHQWDAPEGESVSKILIKGNGFKNCQVGVCCQTCKGAVIKGNTINNTKDVKCYSYYDGIYGLYLIGAYNVDFEGNEISMNHCDSFVKVAVYSYIPKYNGSVLGISIKNNVMRGSSESYGIDIGSSAKKKNEIEMYDNIRLMNNQLKSKTKNNYSELGKLFIEE